VPLNLVNAALLGTPIFNADFADPSAYRSPTNLYAYASNTTSANVPVFKMDQAVGFSGRYLGDALPELPSWTSRGY